MEKGLLIFFITLTVSFAIGYVSAMQKLKKTNFTLAELYVAYTMLQDLNKVKFSNEEQHEDSLHKENFIKFLSDSRDWAFEYIENSQKTIKEVAEELNKDGFEQHSKKLLELLPEKVTE
jgi:hypothetical protein